MNALSFLARLCRDLDVKSPHDLTADARLAILDATNGAIQRLNELSGSKNKTTTGAFALAAPEVVTLNVTSGEADISGGLFTAEQYGRTIRIGDDTIDNQIVGSISLLHPYQGATGSVSATIYSDAVSLPEPYLELLEDPRLLGCRRKLVQCDYRPGYQALREVGTPRTYWAESNARNRNSASPAILRFHPMPEKAYRLEARVTLAPVAIKFADLVAPGESLPFRDEWIESYLFPIARGLMATHDSNLWRNIATKGIAIGAGNDAISRFSNLSPTTHATPSNEVGTPYGF